ncbi:MAG: ATP-binding cassette domain-containing protein [Bryobacteraceae bacterium]|nr:ATP-binding cassette domain-containing protein [Bryobacteraceae bacterium]
MPLKLTAGARTFQRPAFHRAFGPVDLTVGPGESIAVVGRSGVGKSTLARCLAGIDSLTAGTIQWHGPRTSVQLVFQDTPWAMNPGWSVRQILREPLDVAGIGETRGQLEKLLAEAGLSDNLLPRRPEELSGGQRRRLGVARALTLPGLHTLILDEPFAGLDPPAAASLAGVLTRARRERNLALLFITHDLASVHKLADRVLIMADGVFVEELPAVDFLSRASSTAGRALINAMLPGAFR